MIKYTGSCLYGKENWPANYSLGFTIPCAKLVGRDETAIRAVSLGYIHLPSTNNNACPSLLGRLTCIR